MGKEVIVELKNDLSITGVLDSVDQFLNIKLVRPSYNSAPLMIDLSCLGILR